MSSLQNLISDKVYPRIKALCEQFYNEREEMILDGEKAFIEGERFLPGTIVSSFCCLIAYEKEQQQKTPKLLDATREIIVQHSKMELTTFGILEFLTGILLLQKNGLKREVISEDLEEQLKKNLHWNVFYDEEKACLKGGLPTNYYGVAFRVALYREFLGWEEKGMSQTFLAILEEHIKKYSQNAVYMDETNGEGRFDKYSITIASEISEAFLNIGQEVPTFWKEMMVCMTEILLQLADEKASGFSYGRSIGAHGVASIIENIPVALCMGYVEDKAFAYSYCVRAVRQVTDFWYSNKREIITIWDDGRRTDGYRNKTRVLEVNLDMSLKLMRANHLLKGLELHTMEEMEDSLYRKALQEQVTFKYYPFETKQYDRGMVIYRMEHGAFTLPIINGGKEYYKTIPYLPIPFHTAFIQGVANESRPVLVPQITLNNGKKVMPISYMKGVRVTEDNKVYKVEWYQDELCDIEKDEKPEPYEGVTSRTTYTFEGNKISCTYTLKSLKESIEKIEILFETYEPLHTEINNTLYCGSNDQISLEMTGVHVTAVKEVADDNAYHTPYGALSKQFTWEEVYDSNCNEVTIGWELTINDKVLG